MFRMPSNVNGAVLEPITAATVATKTCGRAAPGPAWQRTDVADAQADVWQSVPATAAVAEASTMAKLSPDRVRLVPPDAAPFPLPAKDTAGAAKETVNAGTWHQDQNTNAPS